MVVCQEERLIVEPADAVERDRNSLRGEHDGRHRLCLHLAGLSFFGRDIVHRDPAVR